MELKAKLDDELDDLEQLFKAPEENAFISSYLSHKCAIPKSILNKVVKKVIDYFIARGVKNFFFTDPVKSNCLETFYMPCYNYLLKIKKSKNIKIYSIAHVANHRPALEKTDKNWNAQKYGAKTFYKRIAHGANYILCSFPIIQHETSSLIKCAMDNPRVTICDINYEYLTKRRSNALDTIFEFIPSVKAPYNKLKPRLSEPNRKLLDDIIVKISEKIL